MKTHLAFIAFLMVFAGTPYAGHFSDNFNASEYDYTHYCYRVCCLNLDATYVEGPPQECFGPGATLQAQVQECVDQCLYELGSYYNKTNNPTFITIDQTDLGEIYVPPNKTQEQMAPEETNEDIQPDEVNEENLGTPLIEEEASPGSPASTGSVPLPQKTGGLCPFGFLLLLPLFFSFKK